MSNEATIAAYVFMIVFWAVVIWLFASRTGNNILRVAGSLFALACLGGCLYLHWEPYMAMVCLPAGFIAGVLYAEWHYGVHRPTALRSAQEHQHQAADHTERFQQEPRALLDYERGGQAFQIDRDPGLRG
jgi:hypothetical protein